MLIVLLIINSIIEEININIILKDILTLIMGVSIALYICKMPKDRIEKLAKFSDIIINICKILCGMMVIAIITINIACIKDINKQYSELSSNIEIIDNSDLLELSDVITKKIIINSIQIYDGIQYIYYSIINEDYNVKIILDKYSDVYDNQIINLYDNISDLDKDNILVIVKSTISSRKLFKSYFKLIKIQYFTIISFSVVFYLIIRKIIIFNKKRKNKLTKR